MLESASYRDLKVVDIARAAGTSPATFYQYFPHVEAAVLALAEGLADEGGAELRALVSDHGWGGGDARRTAMGIADGYLTFWERHRALLSVIDLAALDGDQRFRDLRTRLLNGVTLALEDAVRSEREARRGDAHPIDTDPLAVASVLTAMLAHVAAHRPGLEDWGVAGSELRDTMAEIIAVAVAGHAS
jgi:AcrR family transcriptional regulator